MNPTAISLKAGCELFLRYTTRTSELELADIDRAKARLIEVCGVHVCVCARACVSVCAYVCARTHTHAGVGACVRVRVCAHATVQERGYVLVCLLWRATSCGLRKLGLLVPAR